MKKPLRSQSVEITVRPPKWIGGSGRDCEFQARAKGLQSASLISALSAVENFAFKWFWGGITRRFIGPEERAAIVIRKIAANRWRASLKETP